MGILIVDDTDFDRNLLRSILLSAGYEISGLASSGEEGILRFKELQPTLVLLDLIMPDLNGIEVLRRIRVFQPDAKIMMCTSVGEDTMVDLARRMGARGYVVKPYIAENLLSAVSKVMGPPAEKVSG
ncbi:response regulator [Methanospirillum stamsii]|uniref:Two-component system response regulator n=1 Tax=Methanospirillum stamsii TaxID=1277351 RepID=A0A2V2NI97_9EURY|nr:response regulator [Methanospirillum stamsii]PWR76137.1 two-component system response regulator [Methanospirillum stamsii]